MSVTHTTFIKEFMKAFLRPANLRGGQLCEILKGAIFGSMITYMRLVKRGQKFQAFLTQMVQLRESHAEILRVGRPGPSYQSQ